MTRARVTQLKVGVKERITYDYTVEINGGVYDAQDLLADLEAVRCDEVYIPDHPHGRMLLDLNVLESQGSLKWRMGAKFDEFFDALDEGVRRAMEAVEDKW